MRLLTLISDDRYVPIVPEYKYTSKDKKLIQNLTIYRSDSKNIFQELKAINDNLDKVKDTTFPASLPVLFFTASDNDELLKKVKAPDNSWTDCHRLLTSNPLSKTVKMKGSHYLHHKYPEKITQTVTEWISSINKEGNSD